MSCFILVAPFCTCCYNCQELLQLGGEADQLRSCIQVNCEPASILRRLGGIIIILLGQEIMMLRLSLSRSLTS